MARRRDHRRIAVVFAIAWLLLTLYPRPSLLGQSLYRLFYPPVDQTAVEHLLARLPDFQEPAELERFILSQIPYQFDWQTYNMPWYFPRPDEALAKGTGDCKTRLIILASTFEALAIPYELHTSPVHIWIQYEGKIETSIEYEDAAFYVHDGDRFRFQLPRIDWGSGLKMFWEAFWKVMPPEKKIALLFGLSYSVLLFFSPWDSLVKATTTAVTRKRFPPLEKLK